MSFDDEGNGGISSMQAGSTMTLDVEELPVATAEHHLPAMLIPSAIRCQHCHELAHLDVEQRLSGGEIAARYVCPDCNAYQIRHFHESEL
jgi:hypothetical protein